MTLNNPPKAFILLVALICLTLLMALNRVDTEAGLPIISAVVFYAIGNGVAAKSGKDSQPIISSKKNEP